MITNKEKVKHEKSPMKEKVEFEKEKCIKLEEKITKEGGRFNTSLIKLDSSLKVIKDLLFEKNLITEEEYELEFFKKEQIVLNKILEMVKKIKKESSKIVIPKAVPPKDLRSIKA